MEEYINASGNLPNVPSAEDIKENGMNVGEINKSLVEKVEELTLYMIQLSKDLKELKNRNAILLGKLRSEREK